MQTTCNSTSTHFPNTFISNGNTPNICSQTHINVCIWNSVHHKTNQIAQLTVEIKNQHTQANKRLQTTSNSTHLHNIFISNENTPNTCSQTHVNVCIRNSVHHKTSQIAHPTVEIKNQHAHKKKDCRPLPTAHTPPIYSLVTETHHTYACKHILMYAYGIPSTTKPVK